jgi:hypothetical protein
LTTRRGAAISSTPHVAARVDTTCGAASGIPHNWSVSWNRSTRQLTVLLMSGEDIHG